MADDVALSVGRGGKRSTKQSFWRSGLHVISTLTAVIVLWHLGARAYDPQGIVLPGPLLTLQALLQEHQVWLPHAWLTYWEMAVSVLAALAVAVPLSFIMLSHSAIQHVVHTLFLLVQCLPLFVLAPVMVMLFGWSQWNILLPSMLMVLFPLCITLFKGIDTVPAGYVELFQSHNAGLWTTFWKLRLPFATGHLFAGLRVGVATAGMAVAAAEFSGAQRGLGVLLQQARRDFDLPLAFVCIVVLAVGIGLLYWLVVLMERALLPWKYHVASTP